MDQVLEREQRITLLETQIQNEQTKRMQMETERGQISTFQSGKPSDLAELQLNVDKELNRIEHLLSGHVLKTNEHDNGSSWVSAGNDRVIIFSQYGVMRIMNLLAIHVTPATLLSNYSEERVNQILLDFSISLTDMIENQAEMVLSFPTPEDLYEKYLPIVKERKTNLNDHDLYNLCIKLSKQEQDIKQRQVESLIQAVVNFVESTYRRAIEGAERRTLRQSMHISQSVGNPEASPLKKGGFSLTNPKTWAS